MERMKIRQAKGGSLSDARPDLWAAQKQNDEPLAENLLRLTIDTTLPIAEQRKAVISFLPKLLPFESNHERITSTGQ